MKTVALYQTQSSISMKGVGDMKNSTKSIIAAIAVVFLYMMLSWMLSAFFSDIQAYLAALIGTYVVYDVNKTLAMKGKEV